VQIRGKKEKKKTHAARMKELSWPKKKKRRKMGGPPAGKASLFEGKAPGGHFVFEQGQPAKGKTTQSDAEKPLF